MRNLHEIDTLSPAGMGCSAGITSIDLANRLLKCNPNCTALVLSTENITKNQYAFAPRSEVHSGSRMTAKFLYYDKSFATNVMVQQERP